MSKNFDTFNIEKGMPTADEARKLLNTYISIAKKRGIKVCKIIHGYGSSGVGGALRIALRKSLAKRKKERGITDFVFGENWAFLEETSEKIIEVCPELRYDTDLNKHNEGITLILF